MKKLSWTCKSCAMWHSVPDDAHLRPLFCTYDGLPAAEHALRGQLALLADQIPDDYRVRVLSTPMNFKPSWLSRVQREAQELRRLILYPVEGQPFPYLCAACGGTLRNHETPQS